LKESVSLFSEAARRCDRTPIIWQAAAGARPANSTDDPFAKCGSDEAGVERFGGSELNLPFGRP
jgi:hypothetical protein